MVGARGVYLVAFLVAWAGVGCDRPSAQRAQSGLGSTPEKLDFGPSAVGVAKTMKVRLSNRGRAPFRVTGASASLPNVQVVPFEPFELTAGGEHELEVHFTPDVEGAVEGVLNVLTDADNANKDGVANVSMGGQGVKAWVTVAQDALDFGNVELAHVESRELVVSNPSSVESPVRLSFGGADADEFASSEAGTVFTLAPGEERRLPLAFTPGRLGAVTAQAYVEVVCLACEPSAVPLSGMGIAGKLEITPLRVDFGHVAVGAVAQEHITVRNLGSDPMTYAGARLLDSAGGVYGVVTSPALPGNVLPPGGMVQLTVSFSPTTEGTARESQVQLDVRALGTTTPGPKVTLAGEGGGSCVSLQPSPLDFGTVAEGMSTTREVQVLNRCRTDVLMSDVKLTTSLGGYFTLARAPASTPISVGQFATLPITFTPRAGVGAGEAQLTVTVLQGNSTSTVRLPVRGSGRVFSPCAYQLEPEAVEFGRVTVGSEVSLAVGLRNTGTTECYVAGMQLADGSDAAFSADVGGGRVLAAGERAVLHARFQPDARGEFSGMVEAWVNHPTRGHALVSLHGLGVQDCFSVQPTHLDFGVTRLSCGPRERELMVYNNCSEPVTLQGLSAEGDTADFTLTHAFTFPATLGAGNSYHVKVTYTPLEDGEDNAALRFDLGSGAPYTASLTGQGELDNHQTDRFLQQSQAQVDVLFVIDNSGSMQDEQQNLGQNFAAFLGHAQAANVDYHIAVTTTGIEPSVSGWSVCPGGANGGEAGRFFPVDGSSPRIITPATPSPETVFATITNVGICHWDEQGLEGMYRALASPLIYSADDSDTPQPLDGNAGFLREDAKLAIIVISDEEDFSPQAVSFYETFLRGLKGGDPTKLAFSAIVGPVEMSTCPTASSTGSRYMQLAQDTGGVIENICTPDWAASLDRLSENAFGANRTFKLSQPPDDASHLVVKVDGVEVTSGWSYDAATRSVVFTSEATPGPGASVEITYTVSC